ncbi:MAG: ATP-binding protein [Vicinamibacterales bacterium]
MATIDDHAMTNHETLTNIEARPMPLPPLAQLVVPRIRRSDLLLRTAQAAHIDAVLAASANQPLPIVFSGSAREAKRLAAEAIAAEFGLPLYRVDISKVISKYIGETEKNLQGLFDAADSGGAVLLFDEADALFGTRTGVKDSHDKYANQQVDYLLWQIERFNGLAIIATNQKSNIDPAFVRRLRLVIEFED